MGSITLSTLFKVFLKLGATGFGGPVALIALMEGEFASRRNWVSAKEFERAYVFCKLLPGPVAYQMALWIGHRLGGRVGGLCAGIAFLLPAAVLMVFLSHFYSQVKQVPQFESIMEGMRAAAIVVIGDSVWRMLSPYRRDRRAWLFILVAAVFMWSIPRWEPLIIVAGGVAVILSRKLPGRPVAGLSVTALSQLFWVHFKAGAFVFGTGLAIIPVLEADVVGKYHWLTSQEFLDGIAFGQITPGPVTITSAFIGYLVQGGWGASVALMGMYLPGLLMILFILPVVSQRIEGRKWLLDFQDGAVPMVIGCIFGSTLILARSSVGSPMGIGIVVGLAVLSRISRVPAWLLLPLGGLMSFVGAKLW